MRDGPAVASHPYTHTGRTPGLPLSNYTAGAHRPMASRADIDNLNMTLDERPKQPVLAHKLRRQLLVADLLEEDDQAVAGHALHVSDAILRVDDALADRELRRF